MRTTDGRGPGSFVVKAFFVGIVALILVCYGTGRLALLDDIFGLLF